MSGDRWCATNRGIKKDAVISALAEKHASLFTEVANKIDPLHTLLENQALYTVELG